MKVKVLSAVVVSVLSAWLGTSFVSTSELPVEERRGMMAAVEAGHPDSHRLGVLVEERVELPAWDRESVRGELALLTD